MRIETALLHADERLAQTQDIAPPIHPSTTFRYHRDPDQLTSARAQIVQSLGSHLIESGDDTQQPEAFVYSRLHSPTVSRVEAVLSTLLEGNAIAYASGLAAIHALFVFLNPKKVAIGQAYHGTHGILDILKRNYNTQIVSLERIDELEAGDVCWLETPVNPYGTCYNIAEFAKKAHARKALLCIDSTFAPPPMSRPFEFGADYVVHSATKFLGGHSDLLAGVIVTPSKPAWEKLFVDRIMLGSILPTLESFLLLRSLRTFHLRVPVQCRNADLIVQSLDNIRRHLSDIPAGLITNLWHSSLQTEDWVKDQYPQGGCPVFSFSLQSEQACKVFVTSVKVFSHATSLGGVESLVEWRAMSDDDIDPTLIRVSVGVEAVEDLIADIKNALVVVSKSTS